MSEAAFDEVGVEEYYSDEAFDRYSVEEIERLGVDLCTNETKWYAEDYIPFTFKAEDEDEWRENMLD